ncbi:MAG: iron-containing alcohol dehydrogenase [Solirubrobacteraceae bacterium]|nr:iron-containing alcohol dehydrogenase [Solirubrobacteraceae bacterium]
MIVRWGIETLPDVLADLGVRRPLLVTSERWRDLDLPVARRFHGVRAHAEVAGVRAATAALDGADGVVALGGGSAIDTAKAVAVAAGGLPVVSIPTTYSGAEWTPFYGVRDAASGTKGGGGGANVAGIVYDPELTLDLPAGVSGGTALNALAHCAEALYVPGRSDETDADALAGARLIDRWLEPVLADGHDREARRGLLEGAMHAGAALRAGMGVAHAMAQALGGRYGLAHGTMNAICLPPALRFNRAAAPAALDALGEAMGGADPARRSAELADRAGAGRLRDHGVPRDELPDVAAAAAARPAAPAHPRPAGPAEILELLQEAW